MRFLLLFFAGGVLAAFYGLPGWVGFAIAAGAAGAALLLRARKQKLQYARRFSYIIYPIFTSLGLITAYWHLPTRYDFENDILPPLATGVVEELQEKTSGTRFLVKVESFHNFDGSASVYPHQMKVILSGTEIPAKVGHRITWIHELREHTDNQNYREGDIYADRLRKKGILYSQWVASENVLRLIPGTSLKSALLKVRESLCLPIERSSLSTPTKRLLTTILFGDREALTPGERQQFASAGIAHVLALSGMHVGIIIAIILWLLRPLHLIGGFKARFVITVIILWTYAFATGLSPSVVRSSVMATFIAGSVLIQRKNSPLDALCGATFLILLLNPFSIYDIGLQFSFISVAAILVLLPPLKSLRASSIPVWIWETLAVTLVATSATWILTSYYYGQVPTMFLISNLCIVPLLPFYVGAGFLFTALTSMGGELAPLNMLLEWGHQGIKNMALLTGGEGWCIPVATDGVALCLWLAALALAIYAVERKRKRLLSYAVFPALLSLFWISVIQEAPGDMYILRDKTDRMEIAEYSGNKEIIHQLPLQALTLLTLEEGNLLFADCSLDSIPSAVSCDILIIGPHYRGDIEYLLAKVNPGLIVGFNAPYGSEVESILTSIPDIPTHSLKTSGPLRLNR